MNKIYELTVLLHPDLEIDLEKPLKKVEKIITDNKGKVLNTDSWGKKKLSYPIKKQDFAVYVLLEVEMEAANAGKVQELLNITDEVIRYLMVEKDLTAPDSSEESATPADSEDK